MASHPKPGSRGLSRTQLRQAQRLPMTPADLEHARREPHTEDPLDKKRAEELLFNSNPDESGVDTDSQGYVPTL